MLSIKMTDYSFDLPKELIALEPVEPRDTCKLLIYDTKNDLLSFDVFSNISSYIPSKSMMVLNSTRVLPSRIVLKKKSTGGKITALILLNETNEAGNVSLMLDRKVENDETLMLSDKEIFEIVKHKNNSIFQAKMLISESELVDLLEEEGSMPIPLYLRKTKLTKSDLVEKYQTIFAEKKVSSHAQKFQEPLGSIAAPTASLHFTDGVFKSLYIKNINIARINLEVGLGTFAPISEENFQSGTLHNEWFCIKKEEKSKIIEAKNNLQGILACGTTVVRALESPWEIVRGDSLKDEYLSTNIFIRPGHHFKMVDMLLTNFHLPNSSLMMLVEAFLQSKNASKSLKSIYQIAIEKKFRFFSFGDAMLII